MPLFNIEQIGITKTDIKRLIPIACMEYSENILRCFDMFHCFSLKTITLTTKS
jgi:hypothetical protein